MNIEEIRQFCLGKKAVEEGFPFGGDTLVFKAAGKMFLVMGVDSIPVSINIKCEPQKAIELREKYSEVTPGWHMNKTHWNTVICDGAISKKLIFEWINDSYNLIIQSLPKKKRDEINDI
jgi:predicted DNA-binding protein (MmcQ/YjbR family)